LRIMDDAEMREHFGKRVTARMRTLGLTQRALADKMGVTYQAVQKYMTGASLGRGNNLLNLAASLHTTPEFLMSRTDDPDPPIGQTFYPEGSPEKASFIFAQAAHSLGLDFKRPAFPPEWDAYKENEITAIDFYRATYRFLSEIIEQVQAMRPRKKIS